MIHAVGCTIPKSHFKCDLCDKTPIHFHFYDGTKFKIYFPYCDPSRFGSHMPLGHYRFISNSTAKHVWKQQHNQIEPKNYSSIEYARDIHGKNNILKLPGHNKNAVTLQFTKWTMQKNCVFGTMANAKITNQIYSTARLEYFGQLKRMNLFGISPYLLSLLLCVCVRDIWKSNQAFN